MGLSLTSSSRVPTRILVIAGVVFGLIVVSALIISFLLGQRTHQEIATRQTAVETTVNGTGRQVKRVLLERIKNGEKEYVEILWSGTVNVYDKNHRLVKSRQQGFARINSLFSDINKYWSLLGGSGTGPCQLTIETNQGTQTTDCGHMGTGGDQTGGEVIKDINDIIDDTFAPTPTMAPTPTLNPRLPSPTPTTAGSAPSPNPTLENTPGPLTPTPLPGYMTAPPFNCSDYHSDKPFIISNIICGIH